ncbi:hypothetical protein LSAT2_017610 [Lamellibrachia satsuma]|nr:hypothetical protein LSAT2_017610 [Lamellibrachia satsuma]
MANIFPVPAQTASKDQRVKINVKSDFTTINLEKEELSRKQETGNLAQWPVKSNWFWAVIVRCLTSVKTLALVPRSSHFTWHHDIGLLLGVAVVKDSVVMFPKGASPTVDDGCCHFVMEKLQESDEIGMTSNHGQTSPRGFTIDGIKCLDQYIFVNLYTKLSSQKQSITDAMAKDKQIPW